MSKNALYNQLDMIISRFAVLFLTACPTDVLATLVASCKICIGYLPFCKWYYEKG